jgi:hypothetical protein
MSFGYIYKIIFPNGKHYIGLTTTSLEHRQKGHKKCANSGDTHLVYNALRSYNMVDTFELIEIDTADTLEELRMKEIAYIQKYNSFHKNGRGYNMTLGGEGTNGYVFTEEDKQKMSEAAKNYFANLDAEGRQKKSEGHKKPYEDNPELRQQVRETKLKYYKENPGARQQISEANLKRFEDPKEREKNSEAQIKHHKEHPERGKEHSERMQMRFQDNPNLGKEHSEKLKEYFKNPAAIQKNRESQTEYNKEHPEKGKKHSEKMKELFKNPEYKKKIADAKGRNKPFDVFKDEILIKTFKYLFEAEEYLQKEYHITSHIYIGPVLAGQKKSSAGFVFKYK